MKRLELSTQSTAIPVWIGRGLGPALGAYLARRPLRPSRVLVIHDPAVEHMAKSMAAHVPFPTSLLALPQGEKAKRLMTIEQLHAACAKLDPIPDRSSLVVAVGGGAAGDVAALFASTYMRGIPVIHVPTTLLAMVDSSVGGKTGVNTLLGKNMLGTFWQPEAVFADFDALATLPRREYRAALAEVVKTAAVLDASLFALLEKESAVFGINPVSARPGSESYSREAFAANDRAAGGNLMVAAGCMTLEEMVESMVERCLMLKARVVAGDEREAGPRAVLNFGHTVGHAVEKLTDYGLLHGEAVAIGMVAACRVGETLGSTPPAVTARITNLLTRLGLPTALPASLAPDAVAAAAWGDKKRRGSTLAMVLCDAIGSHVMKELTDPAVIAEALGLATNPRSPTQTEGRE